MPGLVKKSNLRLHTTLCVIPIPLQREKEFREIATALAGRHVAYAPHYDYVKKC
jgi:hypothetical protein